MENFRALQIFIPWMHVHVVSSQYVIMIALHEKKKNQIITEQGCMLEIRGIWLYMPAPPTQGDSAYDNMTNPSNSWNWWKLLWSFKSEGPPMVLHRFG